MYSRIPAIAPRHNSDVAMLSKVELETVSLTNADRLAMSRWVAPEMAETEATKAALVCRMSPSAVWMADSVSICMRRASRRLVEPSPNWRISSCMPPISDCKACGNCARTRSIPSTSALRPDFTFSMREVLCRAGAVSISVTHSRPAADHSTRRVRSVAEMAAAECCSWLRSPMIALSAILLTRAARLGRRVIMASSATLASMRSRTRLSKPSRLAITTSN